MRGLWMVLPLALASGACAFDTSGLSAEPGQVPDPIPDPGPDDPGDGGGDDPPPDTGPPECPGKALPFAPSNVDPCDIPTPTANLNLGPDTWTLDTDKVSLTNTNGVSIPLTAAVAVQPGGAPGLVVISTRKLFLARDATVKVIGRRAPVIISFADARIDGTIDLSATGETAGTGAGSDPFCAASGGGNGVAQEDTFRHPGGSGGGGGGFGTAGGKGATVDNPATGLATNGGEPSKEATLVPLRGGCRGGAGGRQGGSGGAGGGAIQIVAATTIQHKGTISVAGSGATGAVGGSAGGGGGGSGGGILLEATTLNIQGKLTANGGGGGEGRLVLDGSDRGDDGKRDAAAPAAGGDSGVFQLGGDGGIGGAGGTAATDGENGSRTLVDAAGGGGGGGGSGRVRLNGKAQVSGGAIISPSPL